MAIFFNKKIKMGVYSILFATAIPLLFTVTWLIINTQLPTSDAANYLKTAVDIYSKYSHDGFWSGLAHTYSIRGWRPIFFPVFLVPFTLLYKGNLIISYDSFVIFSILFTVVYLYFYFRLELTRPFAILSASLICILPHIQVQVLGFYAESILFPCIIATAYHLIKSDYLRLRAHSYAAAFFLSLALLVRPVEAVLHVCLFFSFFVLDGYLKGIFRKKEIINLVFILVSTLWIFGVFVKYHHAASPRTDNFDTIVNLLLIGSSVGVAISGLVASYAVAKEKRRQLVEKQGRTYLYPVVIFTLVVSLAWYLPYAYQTFEWIYQTSFGSVAAGTVRSAGNEAGILQELASHINSEGNFLVYSIGLLALFSLLILQLNEKRNILKSRAIYYLVLISIIPIVEISFTVQDIIRKTAVAFPALLMALIIIGLWRGRFHWLRATIFACLFIFQLLLLSYTVFVRTAYDQTLDNIVGYYLRPPVIISPNPHNQVEAFLTREAVSLKFKTVDLEVNPYTMEPVDPFLMSVIVLAKNSGYSAALTYFPKYDSLSAKNLRDVADVVLLADNANKMIASQAAKSFYLDKFNTEHNPNMKVRYQLLYHYADNSLNLLGWRVGNCITIKSGCLVDPPTAANRADDCRACLLVPA